MKIILAGLLSLTFSMSALAHSGDSICQVHALGHTKNCKRGDIVLLPQTLVPYYCNFHDQIKLLRTQTMAKYGGSVAACVFRGKARKLK